jgi:hypothetical protein
MIKFKATVKAYLFGDNRSSTMPRLSASTRQTQYHARSVMEAMLKAIPLYPPSKVEVLTTNYDFPNGPTLQAELLRMEFSDYFKLMDDCGFVRGHYQSVRCFHRLEWNKFAKSFGIDIICSIPLRIVGTKRYVLELGSCDTRNGATSQSHVLDHTTASQDMPRYQDQNDKTNFPLQRPVKAKQGRK